MLELSTNKRDGNSIITATNIMTTSEATAKQTTVFTFDENGAFAVNLHTHIMESADETTTPHGVGHINYVKEATDPLDGWELRRWVGNGSKSFLVGTVDTEEQAQEWLWEKHCIAFDKDDQRNTSYYDTSEEAEEAYKESYRFAFQIDNKKSEDNE